MADVIDLTSETPSELTENIPLLENSENSENSDESQPKKRPRGRPKSNGKCKYTVNPNQIRGTKLGKKYVLEPKPKTSEQLHRAYLMRKKNNLDHYYRVRAMVIENQRIESERLHKIEEVLISIKHLMLSETTENIDKMITSIMDNINSNKKTLI